MKLLLLNQCFYPDVAATGQYLTDLALGLAERGHKVTVLSGDRGYDDPTKRFPRREKWHGIDIIRIWSLNPGKQTRWRRAVNFGSFLFAGALRLLLLPRFDAVIALTSPPLISFLGSLFVQLKGGKLFVWVMDLNPDEAIAAGWLRETSVTAKLLGACLRKSLRVASKVIVLDRLMSRRIQEKGIAKDKLAIVSPWEFNPTVAFDEQGRESFRAQHNLSGKFVVMYAGNHSPCHPLDTLLQAARGLSAREDIAFCFVGGGSEQKKVVRFASENELKNIVCLPYQPLEKLSQSLSAADLHVVVMGENFAGIVHPCKIYNVLAVGAPFLYIGPDESHITDIIRDDKMEAAAHIAAHGDVDTVIRIIGDAAERGPRRFASRDFGAAERFSRNSLLPIMIELLEQPSVDPRISAAPISQTSA